MSRGGRTTLDRRRGLPAADNALRAPQVRGAARHADPPSRRATPGPLSHEPDQPIAMILLERGTAAAQGRHKLEERLPEILEDADNGLWPRVRELLAELRAEWKELERRILDIAEELLAEAKNSDAWQRLLKVPRIGPQTATAIVAAIGNGKVFDPRTGLGLGARPSATRELPAAASSGSGVSPNAATATSVPCSSTARAARWTRSQCAPTGTVPSCDECWPPSRGETWSLRRSPSS